jgi:hypothetical protein
MTKEAQTRENKKELLLLLQQWRLISAKLSGAIAGS